MQQRIEPSRPKNPPTNHNNAIWLAIQYCKFHRFSYVFPAQLARWAGMTWLEACLALRMGVEYKILSYRRDGRFCYDNSKEQGVANV
jgi:hypothetical protein